MSIISRGLSTILMSLYRTAKWFPWVVCTILLAEFFWWALFKGWHLMVQKALEEEKGGGESCLVSKKNWWYPSSTLLITPFQYRCGGKNCKWPKRHSDSWGQVRADGNERTPQGVDIQGRSLENAKVIWGGLWIEWCLLWFCVLNIINELWNTLRWWNYGRCSLFLGKFHIFKFF